MYTREYIPPFNYLLSGDSFIIKMVCEEIIKRFEKKLGRKLNKEERKKIEEKMHHSEIHTPNKEEELVCA